MFFNFTGLEKLEIENFRLFVLYKKLETYNTLGCNADKII